MKSKGAAKSSKPSAKADGEVKAVPPKQKPQDSSDDSSSDEKAPSTSGEFC